MIPEPFATLPSSATLAITALALSAMLAVTAPSAAPLCQPVRDPAIAPISTPSEWAEVVRGMRLHD